MSIETSLATIKVPNKGLPATEPHRLWALRNRQVRERDSLIYVALLAAPREKFTEECEKQAKKWGFKQVGRIRTIFDKYQSGVKSVVPHLAAEATVHREFKKNEILRDGFNLRGELDQNLRKLMLMRANDERWVEVEENDGKMKKVSIDREIHRVGNELLKSHGVEGDAMKQYMEKIPDKVQVFGSVDLVGRRADDDFKSEFDRMIEVEAEVVDE